ncbi:MAG: ribosome assembly cofactor RimP [Bacteroidales bacterium]|nr:ribosome assembly cofactor RimP [Bacteroidales bacterium]
MIEKVKIIEIVKNLLEGGDKFLVGVKVTPDNRIFVDIDGDNGVTIDDCIELSRSIEDQLDRDVEDFELTVSSAGADSPLKLLRQYRKNVGRDLIVETDDGERLEGTLAQAGDETATLHLPGTKKQPPHDVELRYDEIRSARVAIKF